MFYGRVYHDVSVTYTVEQSKKSQRKITCFRDKSGDSKNVVIVIRTLIRYFMCITIFRRFWFMLCYCRPNNKFHKKTLVKLIFLILYCKTFSSIRPFEW